MNPLIFLKFMLIWNYTIWKKYFLILNVPQKLFALRLDFNFSDPALKRRLNLLSLQQIKINNNLSSSSLFVLSKNTMLIIFYSRWFFFNQKWLKKIVNTYKISNLKLSKPKLFYYNYKFL